MSKQLATTPFNNKKPLPDPNSGRSSHQVCVTYISVLFTSREQSLAIECGALVSIIQETRGLRLEGLVLHTERSQLRCFGHILLWGGPRYAGQIISLGFGFSNASVSSQKSWRRWPGKGRSGCLCLDCSCCDPEKQQKIGWMDNRSFLNRLWKSWNGEKGAQCGKMSLL